MEREKEDFVRGRRVTMQKKREREKGGGGGLTIHAGHANIYIREKEKGERDQPLLSAT